MASAAVLAVVPTCGGNPPPSTSGPLLSFQATSWIGGQQAVLPEATHTMGLELTSIDASPATAEHVGRLNLARFDWTHSILRLRFYVSDVTNFDEKVFGSRLEFLSNFTGTDAYVVWFDQSLTSGWNDIEVPLTNLGTLQGNPVPSLIVGVLLTVYSIRQQQVQVYFASLTEQTL